MPGRNTDFGSHAPFHQELATTEQLSGPSSVTGPFSFFNPTSARFSRKTGADGTKRHGSLGFLWSSRSNRKGRHELTISPSADSSSSIATPSSSRKFSVILRGLRRMMTHYPVWDISWIVAYIFTWGSIVWVLNAMFVFLPLIRPQTVFRDEILSGGGITAFIGATIFEVGSVFLILEALNEEKSGCFGWAVEEAIKEGHERRMAVHKNTESCKHSHCCRHNLFYNHKGFSSEIKQDPSFDSLPATQTTSWVWYPSWHSLKTHYVREIGFLACLSQLIGASIFWIAGLTALPGINNEMSQGLLDGVYWTPQVVGGCGFIISGFLFMLETQTAWWKPNFGSMGWHIGAWNFLGGIGFTLSGAFGYKPTSWALYQSACSTFWGSFAFLIGSVIQWYESLDKFPVTIDSATSESDQV